MSSYDTSTPYFQEAKKIVRLTQKPYDTGIYRAEINKDKLNKEHINKSYRTYDHFLW